ncbi:MAG: SDR family NAD(P)-dependent oxidoreductase [bacterium]|nr:SDR family NAD(P)-dependent oxidoreductase [bacterium]
MNDEFFRSKVVIVTGAAGFIGSHLCDKLLELGAKVHGLDNLITGQESNLSEAKKNQNFSFHQVDLNDEQATLAVLQKIQAEDGLDAVLHFASPASPPLYQRWPTQTYLVNTLALHNLLTWLKENVPASRLLFAGTSEAYGTPLEHPQKETYWGNVNPNGPRSCYDEAKRLGETICGVFYRDFDFDTRIVRIFNTYGPRMSLADGRILPQFIKEYLANEKLTIYGDGSQTRSYCYIDDLVRGILTFLAAPDLAGETINLGNPHEFTVLETAKIFNEAVGRPDDDFQYLCLPKDDPTRRQPDITKAQKLLQYRPTVEFRDGLKLMIASYKKEN